MSYQVLARKYRPQQFDGVVGQQGVTQTLRNAIEGGRLAQAYIFAGPRGVGKTTTARILAKALNCVSGPTVEPCGQCDACREIAEGRDIDVVEIDGATNTRLEETKAVIIDGLPTRPVRDRFKIFIIDEVHQLSTHSFNALLKSIEEPPPHVVFMMATTELHKIPDTIRSRSQEFEFRTIRTRAIIEQLRAIAETEGIAAEPAALALVARAAEGSMRDAESSLDQVIAFAGRTVTAADVSTVLGLVGRDFLLDIVETVAEENAARVFDLAAKAVESGQDLRLLCRELARVVRDMMVVTIDPARIDDPEFAPEGDVPRLQAAAARFSREDLLRAFDVIARAEYEVRTSAQPRYHLEMALLRWIHLRKLQPLAEIIEALGRPGAPAPSGTRAGLTAAREAAAGPIPQAPRATPAAPAPRIPPVVASVASDASVGSVASEPPPQASAVASASPASIKEAFVEQVRQKKKLLHGTLLAQAKRIEVEDGLIRLYFGPSQRVLRKQVEESRPVLEQIAASVTGQPTKVQAVEIEEAAGPASDGVPAAGAVSAADAAQKRLREQALADNAVQAMLDVFPAEIRDVEEIDR